MGIDDDDDDEEGGGAVLEGGKSSRRWGLLRFNRMGSSISKVASISSRSGVNSLWQMARILDLSLLVWNDLMYKLTSRSRSCLLGMRIAVNSLSRCHIEEQIDHFDGVCIRRIILRVQACPVLRVSYMHVSMSRSGNGAS